MLCKRPATTSAIVGEQVAAEMNAGDEVSADHYEFDVCLSFADEQRPYVQAVAELLARNGLRVFYDTYEQVTLWGKDLYEHLDDVYRTKSKYCVLFVSADYARKVWTNHERKSAQARALLESEEYVLPVRFDDTELPGIRPTVGYIDARSTSSVQLAELVSEKVASFPGGKGSDATRDRTPIGVPRTADEQELLIELKPNAWEYLLFAGVLVQGKAMLHGKSRDHQLRYARRVRRISGDSEALQFLEDAMSNVQGICDDLEKVMDPAALEWAFGAEGCPGDVENIVHLGKRFIRAYEDLFDWSADLRATSPPSAFEGIFEIAARFMTRPILQVGNFIDVHAAQLDSISERLDRGEQVMIDLTLTLSLDEEVGKEYRKGLKSVRRQANRSSRWGISARF